MAKNEAVRIQVKVLVGNNLDLQTQASLAVGKMETLQSVQLALKYLGIWWGAALLCVLIPVFHFVLVPAGLLIGIWAATKQFRYQDYISEGKISCPKCSAEMTLKDMPFNWPIRQTCPQCQADLIVES